MEPVFKIAESTVEPETIRVEDDIVRVRKDINAQDRQDTNGSTVTYYSYLEAVMTKQEYETYSKKIALENKVAIDDLSDGQVNRTSNELAIMEAISDLYEMLLSITQ